MLNFFKKFFLTVIVFLFSFAVAAANFFSTKKWGDTFVESTFIFLGIFGSFLALTALGKWFKKTFLMLLEEDRKQQAKKEKGKNIFGDIEKGKKMIIAIWSINYEKDKTTEEDLLKIIKYLPADAHCAIVLPFLKTKEDYVVAIKKINKKIAETCKKYGLAGIPGYVQLSIRGTAMIATIATQCITKNSAKIIESLAYDFSSTSLKAIGVGVDPVSMEGKLL